jgi:hypothetical protein
MDEIGIDIAKHKPHSFADLEDDGFDLIVSLSPEAHHTALEYTRTMAVNVVYWPTIDPTAVQGSREQMLDAYRGVRDGLQKRIKEALGWRPMMPRKEESAHSPQGPAALDMSHDRRTFAQSHTAHRRPAPLPLAGTRPALRRLSR